MKQSLLLSFGILIAASLMTAQSPHSGPMLSFTATTENITGAHDSVRIDLLRWSSDAEREQLVTAWTQPSPVPVPAGRGRGAAAAAAGDEAGDAAAGRGGRGRGGRGGGAPARMTPEASLAAALEKAPVVGYLWSSEVAGYAIHSAVQMREADGSERVVLVTDRRLGESNDAWKPVGGDTTSAYPFSVIELHLNAKGEGEGKISLTGKVVPDAVAKTMAPENYAGLPVVLKNVRRRSL